MKNIKNILLRKIFKYSSYLLKYYENHLIQKTLDKKNNQQILIILGAPRTGSTILYQILTSFLDVSYINNFIYLGREIPFIAFLLNKKFFNQKGHFSFNSEYGNTFKQGLNAPSEAGLLWRNWMPENKIYLTDQDINNKNLKGFSSFLSALTKKTHKPLVIKNLYFSQRLHFLKKTGLDCRFIFIKRNPLYTAQSILISRKNNLKNINNWWSVEPYNYEEIKGLDLYEQIVAQVYYIEKQISNDLKLFEKNNVLTINYEDLSDNLEQIIIDIKEFIQCDYRKGTDIKALPDIKVRNQKKLNNEEFQKIKNAVSKYFHKC